jgi:hypothetical protein
MDRIDIEDTKLARPVAIVDLWDIDDRINQLTEIAECLKGVTQALLEHAHDERVRDFERILSNALDREDARRNGKKFIKPIFKVGISEVDSEFDEEVLDQ